MNNAVFGKFMENVRNRIDFELVTDKERIVKLSQKPRYKSSRVFTKNVVGVELHKTKVLLNKPIMIGACILDLSKVHMYDFHYNTMKKRYGDKCSLLFTDTDSLMYHIETEDIYKDMAENKNLYDLGGYVKTNPLYDNTNNKVIGKFKDESPNSPIIEFIGLKSKMYSYLTEEGECKKAKGVKTNVVKNDICHNDYKNCLFSDAFIHKARMSTIRSYKHQLYSITLNKTGLSSYEDKSYYFNNVTSVRHGHYRTRK
jgi:hypothetical protein